MEGCSIPTLNEVRYHAQGKQVSSGANCCHVWASQVTSVGPQTGRTGVRRQGGHFSARCGKRIDGHLRQKTPSNTSWPVLYRPPTGEEANHDPALTRRGGWPEQAAAMTWERGKGWRGMVGRYACLPSRANTLFKSMTGLLLLIQGKVSTLSSNTCQPCLRALQPAPCPTAQTCPAVGPIDQKALNTKTHGNVFWTIRFLTPDRGPRRQQGDPSCFAS